MLVDDFDAAVTDLDDVRADQTYLEGEYWEGYKKAAAWTDLNEYWKYSCTYCFALKRADFLKVGPFDPHFTMYGFEDVDLGFRLFKQGLRFGFVDATVFHLFPRKEQHNYHIDQMKRVQTLSRSALTFFLLRPERLPFSICQGYFAPTLPMWLMSPVRSLAKPFRPKSLPLETAQADAGALSLNA
jgi:hypothetical protein